MSGPGGGAIKILQGYLRAHWAPEFWGAQLGVYIESRGRGQQVLRERGGKLRGDPEAQGRASGIMRGSLGPKELREVLVEG